MDYSRKLTKIDTGNVPRALEDLFRLISITQEESARYITQLEKQNKELLEKLESMEGTA